MPFQFYCPQGHLLEGHESQMGQQSQCPICGGVFVIPMAPGMPGPQPGWSPGYSPQPPGYYPPQTPAAPPGAFVGYPTYPGAFQPGYSSAGAYPGGYVGGPMPGGQQPWAGYEQPPPQPGYPGGAAMVPGGMSYPGAAADATPGASSPAPFTDFQIQTEPAAAGAEVAAPAPPVEEPKPEPPPEKQEPRVVRIPCPQGHELQTPMDMVAQDVLCPICGTQFHLRYEDSVEFKEEQAELQRRKAERVNQVALKWSIGAAVVVVLGILGMMIYLAFAGPAEPTHNPAIVPAVEEPAGKPNRSTSEPANDTPAPTESTEADTGP